MNPIANFKSNVEFCVTWPHSIFDRNKDLLIIDSHVLQKNLSIANDWKFVYLVSGGETLKDLAHLPEHYLNILKTWQTPISRKSRIIACGGGSVGDFAGFIASTLKRGVELIHVPSTWLAAIDSAHGGKTALNVGGIKNQVGTFYPASHVYLVRSLLTTQPDERASEALGELLKMALLDKKQLLVDIASSADLSRADLVWKYLKPAVDLKYQIVLQDPLEQSGVRKILNLGHTLGHVLESHFLKPHGDCVLQGLMFALEWSFYKKILSQPDWIQILMVLRVLNITRWTEQPGYKPVPRELAQLLLQQDKKINSDGSVDFVFLEAPGKPRVQAVQVMELLSEAERQGWICG